MIKPILHHDGLDIYPFIDDVLGYFNRSPANEGDLTVYFSACPNSRFQEVNFKYTANYDGYIYRPSNRRAIISHVVSMHDELDYCIDELYERGYVSHGAYDRRIWSIDEIQDQKIIRLKMQIAVRRVKYGEGHISNSSNKEQL